MEYVANAQGQDVAVPTAASPSVVGSTQPASVSGNATTVVRIAPLSSNGAAQSAPVIMKVTGLSALESLKDTYEREVARVEAEAASLKAFASRVASSVETEVTSLKAKIVAHALTFAAGSSVGVAAQALWKFL